MCMSDSDRGVDAWREHSSAFERVASVSQSVTEPQSAAWIANEAAVSEETAQRHLDQLVDITVLMEFCETDTTTYAPDPLYTRFQTIRKLLEKNEFVNSMEGRIAHILIFLKLFGYDLDVSANCVHVISKVMAENTAKNLDEFCSLCDFSFTSLLIEIMFEHPTDEFHEHRLAIRKRFRTRGFRNKADIAIDGLTDGDWNAVIAV